jgi:hypothetical protein
MDFGAYWFEDEVWQGFLPTESRSALLERHVFQTYVAGLRYFPDGRDDPTFVPGSRLTLTPILTTLGTGTRLPSGTRDRRCRPVTSQPTSPSVSIPGGIGPHSLSTNRRRPGSG